MSGSSHNSNIPSWSAFQKEARATLLAASNSANPEEETELAMKRIQQGAYLRRVARIAGIQKAEETEDNQGEGDLYSDSGEEDLMNFFADLVVEDNLAVDWQNAISFKSSKKGSEAEKMKMTMKMKEKKRKKKENMPFLSYGVGVQNYFEVQTRLIYLFLLLSLLAIPQMVIYGYFEGFNYTNEENVYTALSFGNMGYSSNNCG